MGFFSSIKKFFSGGSVSEQPKTPSLPHENQEQKEGVPHTLPDGQADDSEQALTLALQQAEPKLSAWLHIILDGIKEADGTFWSRLSFLLRALQTPEEEAHRFTEEFRSWLDAMDYRQIEDFRSELQYRLALALDMEDEEDERDRLFAKLQNGLARTRSRLGQGLEALFSGHADLDQAFWDEMEELFIMSDMGAEPSIALVASLKERARQEGIRTPDTLMPLLEQEIEAIFRQPRRITCMEPPEVLLMVGERRGQNHDHSKTCLP